MTEENSFHASNNIINENLGNDYENNNKNINNKTNIKNSKTTTENNNSTFNSINNLNNKEENLEFTPESSYNNNLNFKNKKMGSDIESEEKILTNLDDIISVAKQIFSKKHLQYLNNIKIKFNKLIDIDLELNNLKFQISKLNIERIIRILFSWIVLFINLSIYFNEDFSVLFFSHISNVELIIMVILFLFYILIETVNKIYSIEKIPTLDYITFFVYFVILTFILLKSLFLNEGFGIQFYLLIILINIEIIIMNKLYLRYEKNDINDITSNYTPIALEKKKSKYINLLNI